jgi:hypothetical protein
MNGVRAQFVNLLTYIDLLPHICLTIRQLIGHVVIIGHFDASRIRFCALITLIFPDTSFSRSGSDAISGSSVGARK